MSEEVEEYTGDPLHPDTEQVAPAELVAGLSHSDRKRRVSALVNQADEILADAVEIHGDGKEIVATCLMWSGGNDSNTLAHLMRSRVTHAVMANTGIGIEETRRFVRNQAAAWGLPLIEKHPPSGSTYEALVTDQGFPGPGHHWKMYQRLKERCFRQARAELVANPRKQRVLFVAGRRRAESKRRAGGGDKAPIPLYERQGSVIWVSPMAMWTKLDINTYRHIHGKDVPHNEVCDHLHMSGECLCGAFAKRDELDQIRMWYPGTAQHIEDLQDKARANGVPEERCQWGWGAYRSGRNRIKPSKVGIACSSCDGRFEDEAVMQ